MNRIVYLLAASALIVGCGGKDEGPGEQKDECTNILADPFPAPGEAAAFYRTTVEGTYTTADPAIMITLTGPGGAVAGATSWDDNRLVFTPSKPLDPSSDYTATFSGNAGCDDAVNQFSTSEVGSEISPNDLVGRTFALDLSSGRFVEPPGIGDLLSSYLTFDILIGITSAGNSLEMMGALGAEGVSPPDQDFCTQTIAFPTDADFSENPFFAIGPADTTLSVEGFTVELGNLLISGAFGPDGDYIAGAVLAGDIDVRQDVLSALLGDDSTPDEACGFVAAVGITCQPCASDNKPYCLSLYVDSISAELVPGLVLVPLEGDQVENHLCEDTCTNVDGSSVAVDDDGDSILNANEVECNSANWP